MKILDRSWTEINLNNYLHNLNQLKKVLNPQTKIMQIVKADAYGHGALEIAKQAVKFGINYLGVANVEEGALLRYQNIKIPILILSPSIESEIEIILEYSLTVTISDFSFAKKLNDAMPIGKIQSVHINIDSGMGRSGVEISNAISFIKDILELKNLKIEGIFSHFAASESDQEFSLLQINRFVEIIKQINFKPQFVHISNSSGILYDFPSEINMIRLGLLSYGCYSNNNQKEYFTLKPVMSFKSRISSLKQIEKGNSIGYNRTFIAYRNLTYAILPIGYADGYDFLLSNKGFVSINGFKCPILGKISMDMIAVDITDISNCKIGDEVVLIGEINDLRVENIALLFNGSPYELLCQIGRRAKRYYFKNNKLIYTTSLARRDFISSDFSDKKLNRVIEAALNQRMQGSEISEIIYNNILKKFFYDRDKQIFYRKNFCHTIEFSNTNLSQNEHYYHTKTTLTFNKILQNDYFIVACANSSSILEKYLLRPDVEYRWLLDEHFALQENKFKITSVKINDFNLFHEAKMKDGCIEIYCSHNQLSKFIGKEVKFSISTETFYPKSSHQLSIFITEMTQGVDLSFIYPSTIKIVDPVPIFSGNIKFPKITKMKNKVTLKTNSEEWIFPNSGIVFSY